MSISRHLVALVVSKASLCILSKASGAASIVSACLLLSASMFTARGLESVDVVIDANGETADKPVVAVRAERLPNLGKLAEFRVLCTNGNKLGHLRNGNFEHRARKSRSISRLTTSAFPLLHDEYASVNQ
jgi:hypothetical protein